MHEMEMMLVSFDSLIIRTCNSVWSFSASTVKRSGASDIFRKGRPSSEGEERLRRVSNDNKTTAVFE